jgi:hypothetical protein
MVAMDLIDDVSDTFRFRARCLCAGDLTARKNTFLGRGPLDSSSTSSSHSPSDALVNSDEEEPLSSRRDAISEDEALSVLAALFAVRNAGHGERGDCCCEDWREARCVVERRFVRPRTADASVELDDEVGMLGGGADGGIVSRGRLTGTSV